MKLDGIFENALPITEIFNTKVSVDSWTQRGNVLVGALTITDQQYEIYLEPRVLNISPQKSYNIINIAFAKLVDGLPSSQLTLTSGNASSVIGAMINAMYNKLPDYDYDAVVFVARDNTEQRMRVYNNIAHTMAQKFGPISYDIKLPNGALCTLLFNKDADKIAIQEIQQHISETQKDK